MYEQASTTKGAKYANARVLTIKAENYSTRNDESDYGVIADGDN